METLSHLRLSREETRPFKSTNMLLSSLRKEDFRFLSKYSKNDSASDLSKKIICKLSSLDITSKLSNCSDAWETSHQSWLSWSCHCYDHEIPKDKYTSKKSWTCCVKDWVRWGCRGWRTRRPWLCSTCSQTAWNREKVKTRTKLVNYYLVTKIVGQLLSIFSYLMPFESTNLSP